MLLRVRQAHPLIQVELLLKPIKEAPKIPMKTRTQNFPANLHDDSKETGRRSNHESL